MSRSITHVLWSQELSDDPNQPGLFPAQEIRLRINRVGSLEILVQAQLVTKNFPPPPPLPEPPPILGQPPPHGQPPIPTPPGGDKPFHISPFNFPWTLLDPDGQPYTKATITMEDLNRYRDLRGFVRLWTLHIPESFTEPTELSHVSGPQVISVTVHEIIPTSSAQPLVDERFTLTRPRREFEFDLYRLGRFSARVRREGGPFGLPTLPVLPIKISLLRPDGSVMVTDDDGRIDVMITAPDLRQSRGPDGVIRKWKLQVEAVSNKPHKILARVIDTVRIPVSVLQARLGSILGPNGEKLTLGARWNDSRATNQFTLRINDQQLAETFGMHDVLDGFDRGANLGVDLNNPEINRDYVISENRMILEEGFNDAQALFRNIETTFISINMGVSVERRALKYEVVSTDPLIINLGPTGDVLIPANLPLFSVDMKMSGFVHLDVNNWDDGALVSPNLRLEIALEIKPDGRLGARCWVDPHSFQFGDEEGSPHHPFRNDVNHLRLKLDRLSPDMAKSLTDVFEGIFDRLMGGAFHFTAARWTGAAMEFDYIAGVEPERKRNIGYVARGNFGIGMGPQGPIIRPSVDTWKSPNLAKIDHIVVLMMENRSFDHVLGYLSLEPPPVATPGIGTIGPGITPNRAINPKVDGLTQKIIEDFSVAGNRSRHLAEAGFAANAAGLKTKLPLGVGHSVADTIQQMAGKTMKGFAANFDAIHSTAEFQQTGCQPQDALGYYTDFDLAMYEFLSREFAICDRYFCSHPGPTLPNRMYSLIGDLQHDRNGEPRINNGVDSTFFLSRDQTIFDILSQRGVSWRVYESFPSVTMLRMFTRYAGDETNIRDIRNLESDIQSSGLPSVTFIDPAMHDAPANDDHPPADMLHGQHLIRRVYAALRANPAVWNKTMLIITYDEHGGFFDHVVPPIAEVLQDPRKVLDSQAIGTVSGAGGAVISDGGVLDPNPGTPAAPGYGPNQEIIYGLRVPTFVISPWVRKGAVIKRVVDHVSILKTILVKFCARDRPFLSDRVHHAFDLGPALARRKPRNVISQPPVLPELPDLRTLAAAKAFRIIRKREITADNSDFHDFMEVLSRIVSP